MFGARFCGALEAATRGRKRRYSRESISAASLRESLARAAGRARHVIARVIRSERAIAIPARRHERPRHAPTPDRDVRRRRRPFGPLIIRPSFLRAPQRATSGTRPSRDFERSGVHVHWRVALALIYF